MKSKDVIEKLAAQGADAEGSTSDDMSKLILSETKKWGDVIRQSGVKLE